MKMSKQTGQVLILAVLMVVLVGFGIFQFTAGTKPPPPPPPPADAGGQAPAKDTAAKNTASGAIISWIELERVPKLVAETTGKRNPFEDLILYETGQKILVDTTKSDDEPPVKDLGDGPPVMGEVHNLSVTLDWITPRQVAKAMSDAGLAVMLRAGNSPDTVIIEGENPDFDDALMLIRRLNVPPPPPPFVLTGIMLSPGSRYAAVGLEGNVYTVLEGEPVPTTDWTVTHISPTTVTLKKGKQSVSLRLAGGSPS